MYRNIDEKILVGIPLGCADAARLVAECVEEMGEMFRGGSRAEALSAVRRVLRAGVAVVRAAEHTVTFETAAWDSVEARKDRRPTTTRDLRNYVRRMLRVEGVAQMPLRGMTTAQCRMLLKSAFGSSRNSYRKGRAILHSVFAHGMRQEWCEANPVARIEVPRVVEKRIVPLQVHEVKRLCAAVAAPEFQDMRFSLSLLLYSGVRPAEVARLRPEDVFWNERQVMIRPHASKTGGGRMVKLRPLGGMQREDCYVPVNWQRRWRQLRRLAGFSRWVPDVCRHTFATYHAAYYRNMSELQLEMGHRDSFLLRSRYMVPTVHKQAAVFWKLRR